MPDNKNQSNMNKEFSKYPVEINNIFKEENVIISTFPSFINTEFIKNENSEIKFTSMDQYAEFLKKEIEFWEKSGIQNKIESWNIVQSLNSAQSYFKRGKEYITMNLTEATRLFHYSIDSIKNNLLYSETMLAQFLVKQQDKNNYFFDGFKKVIDKNVNGNTNILIRDLEGAYFAYMYKHATIQFFSTKQFNELKTQIANANNNYSALNACYLDAFETQKKRLIEMTNSNDQHIKKLTNDTNKFWDDNVKRRDELEKLYYEKLSLEAPAKHWDDMADKYNKKGNKWLKTSIGLALIIVAGLIFTLQKIFNYPSTELNWFGIIRNYVILTATVGIGFYMLRFCVKICMSNYHQSRDAEERSKLAEFYLSLKEKGAVEDKERALIINSLFSRTETGLLKGDSTPIMSQNITDLMETVIKK